MATQQPRPRMSRYIYEQLPEDEKYPFPNVDGSVTIDRIGIGGERFTYDIELVDGPLFSVGRLVISVGIVEALKTVGSEIAELAPLVLRHAGGDWAGMVLTDQFENDTAARYGGRVLSEYEVDGRRVWIVSDARGPDGSRTTTILLPFEF